MTDPGKCLCLVCWLVEERRQGRKPAKESGECGVIPKPERTSF